MTITHLLVFWGGAIVGVLIMAMLSISRTGDDDD